VYQESLPVWKALFLALEPRQNRCVVGLFAKGFSVVKPTGSERNNVPGVKCLGYDLQGIDANFLFHI
jgi:hypothetical protein